ncbi:site-specific integrase [Mycobacterium koreense]|uniref:Uncharacterized protein n=1 Tax=Mycolicibacillus koreensis TaxID=1069220 RepID=A0A7I7SBW8_9MYCO|nr:tyrosine-type recombinase/integrase [Mycolicibacillus koreensis]MCV7247816.1 site-specific integrase [Mycolicibacillus koreensis]OSC34669.1 hypothetical protein B8W67_05320 [Mycolicibacillus koreensis]BBY54203.1 integrase [Mycolicibacillus koreensis]
MPRPEPNIRRIETRDRRGRAVTRWRTRKRAPAGASGPRQPQRTFDTYREAKRWRDTITADTVTGSYVAPNRRTVKDAVDEWLAAKRLRTEKTTTTTSYGYAVAPIVDELGGIELQQLTEARIEKFLSDLRAGDLVKPDGRKRPPWKATTTAVTLAKLRDILARQVRQKTLQASPAEHIEAIPIPASERYVPATLSPDDLDVFFAHITGDRLEHCWYLALLGLRRGEIAALRWDCVDIDAGMLAVRGNRVAVPGGTEDTSTKTAAGQRVLPMPPQLVSAMRRARERQSAEKLAAGDRYRDEGWVAADRFGRPHHPDTLSDRWAAAVAAAGVPHVTLHGGRHTALTILHLEGVPLAVVAAWAGHTDSAFTLRRYAHSQTHMLGEAATVWDRIVRPRAREGEPAPAGQ